MISAHMISAKPACAQLWPVPGASGMDFPVIPLYLRSVDEIGYPKKSCGQYIVSKNVLMTLCSVKKCLIDAI